VTRVFIGGSRHITRLEDDVRRRLDRIVEKGLPVVIGDANGADKAVQRYLREQKFERVEVYCADESPRNNAGGWPVRVIRPGHARRDFDYYATKDRAMAAAATVGLMVWDGQSRGTLMNVLRLADRNKPVVVYVQPRKGFVDVRTRSDISALLAELDRETARRLQADAAAEGLGQGVADQPTLGF
jgi:adenine-specific DNA-methyltransferase